MRIRTKFYCAILTLHFISLTSLSTHAQTRQIQNLKSNSPVCSLNNRTPYIFSAAPSATAQNSSRIQNLQTDVLRVLVWNVFKYKRDGVYSDLSKLKNQSDLVLLQEAVHRPDIETYFKSHFPDFSQTFFMSFCDSDASAFGVQNGSRFQVLNNQSWPAPDSEPFSTIHKMSGYSEILINGQRVHVVNTHGLNFNAGSPFQRQIDDVAKRLKNVTGPIIWAGDFNTWSNSRMNYLLGVTKKLGLSHVQFKNDPRGLVLDHVFYRGLNLKKSEIIEISTSDHYPLLVEFSISEKQKSESASQSSAPKLTKQQNTNPLHVQ